MVLDVTSGFNSYFGDSRRLYPSFGASSSYSSSRSNKRSIPADGTPRERFIGALRPHATRTSGRHGFENPQLSPAAMMREALTVVEDGDFIVQVGIEVFGNEILEREEGEPCFLKVLMERKAVDAIKRLADFLKEQSEVTQARFMETEEKQDPILYWSVNNCRSEPFTALLELIDGLHPTVRCELRDQKGSWGRHILEIGPGARRKQIIETLYTPKELAEYMKGNPHWVHDVTRGTSPKLSFFLNYLDEEDRPLLLGDDNGRALLWYWVTRRKDREEEILEVLQCIEQLNLPKEALQNIFKPKEKSGHLMEWLIPRWNSRCIVTVARLLQKLDDQDKVLALGPDEKGVPALIQIVDIGLTHCYSAVMDLVLSMSEEGQCQVLCAANDKGLLHSAIWKGHRAKGQFEALVAFVDQLKPKAKEMLLAEKQGGKTPLDAALTCGEPNCFVAIAALYGPETAEEVLNNPVWARMFLTAVSDWYNNADAIHEAVKILGEERLGSAMTPDEKGVSALGKTLQSAKIGNFEALFGYFRKLNPEQQAEILLGRNEDDGYSLLQHAAALVSNEDRLSEFLALHSPELLKKALLPGPDGQGILHFLARNRNENLLKRFAPRLVKSRFELALALRPHAGGATPLQAAIERENFSVARDIYELMVAELGHESLRAALSDGNALRTLMEKDQALGRELLAELKDPLVMAKALGADPDRSLKSPRVQRFIDRRFGDQKERILRMNRYLYRRSNDRYHQYLRGLPQFPQLEAAMEAQKKELQEEIAKLPNGEIKQALELKKTQLAAFNLSFIRGLRYSCCDPELEGRFMEVWQRAVEFTDVTLRSDLTTLLSLAGLTEQQLVRLPDSSKGCSMHIIPLAALEQRGVSSSLVEELDAKIKAYKREASESTHLGRMILRALVDLYLSTEAGAEDLDYLIKMMLVAKDAESMIKVCAAVSQIKAARLGVLLITEHIKGHSGGLDGIAQDLFRTVIPIEDIGNLQERFHHAFGSKEGGELVTTYATKIMRDPRMTESFTRWLKSILDGSYEAKRYSPDENQHQSRIYELCPSLRMDLPALCSQPWASSTVAELKVSTQVEQALDWQSLCDTLSNDQLDRLGTFKDFAAQKKADEARAKEKDSKPFEMKKYTKDLQRSLGKEVQTRSNQVNQMKDKAEAKEACDYLRQQMAELRLQKALISLCLTGTDTTKGRALRTAIAQAQLAGGFTDLVRFLEKVNQQKKAPASPLNRYEVRVTDDYWSLFNSGNAFGTCQRVTGSYAQNKGLIGLLWGGSSFLIEANRPEDKRMRARCIIRVLVDEDKKALGLFAEHIYTHEKDPRVAEAMWEMARRVAFYLEVPLYARSGGRPSPQLTLTSHPHSAPWGYSDSGGGAKTNNAFTIHRPDLIFDPSPASSSS